MSSTPPPPKPTSPAPSTSKSRMTPECPETSSLQPPSAIAAGAPSPIATISQAKQMANNVDVPSPSDKNEQVAPPTKEARAPALEPPKRPPSATKRATSNRCHKGDCNERVVKIIGDCRYCMHKFCTRHRLPELHLCSNMQKCRDTSAKRLKNKLLGEKCVAEKV